MNRFHIFQYTSFSLHIFLQSIDYLVNLTYCLALEAHTFIATNRETDSYQQRTKTYIFSKSKHMYSVKLYYNPPCFATLSPYIILLPLSILPLFPCSFMTFCTQPYLFLLHSPIFVPFFHQKEIALRQIASSVPSLRPISTFRQNRERPLPKRITISVRRFFTKVEHRSNVFLSKTASPLHTFKITFFFIQNVLYALLLKTYHTKTNLRHFHS